MRKHDKSNRHYYRSSDRVFQSDGGWYYETREADRGPFATREQAIEDLSAFISNQQHAAAGADEQAPST